MLSEVKPPPSEHLPLPCAVSAEYGVRLARDPDEIRAAQRLRFEVFNLEMREGLESSYRTGLDCDRFDSCFDHIVVFHEATGELAGTYRVQSGEAAALGQGYYSEQEFDFEVF